MFPLGLNEIAMFLKRYLKYYCVLLFCSVQKLAWINNSLSVIIDHTDAKVNIHCTYLTSGRKKKWWWWWWCQNDDSCDNNDNCDGGDDDDDTNKEINDDKKDDDDLTVDDDHDNDDAEDETTKSKINFEDK